jgi:hypothetical protein
VVKIDLMERNENLLKKAVLTKFEHDKCLARAASLRRQGDHFAAEMNEIDASFLFDEWQDLIEWRFDAVHGASCDINDNITMGTS